MRKISILFFHVLVITGLGAQNTPRQLALATPYDAMWVHLHYLQADSYQPGMAALAFTGADSLTRVSWAVKLKQVLDGSGLYVQMNRLPQDPDYLDSLSKKHFYTPFPDALPAVYLEKSGDQWFYAQETNEQINALHRDIYPFGTDLLVHFFGKKSEKKFLGISIWQYVGIFIILACCFVAYFILTYSFRWLIQRLTRFTFEIIPDFIKQVRSIANYASVALVIWLVKLLLPLLQLPVQSTAVLHKGIRIAITLLVMLLALRIASFLMAYFATLSERTESRMDDQFVPMLKQVAKVIIVILALLHILSLLDFNITALIAGLSIGGLALALAAQDTVKNFLGSVMIFADRPFQIGDFVEGSGFVGTVVEVGFRSTRIRTADTSIISVPNGSMANISVTNKGARTYRLFTTSLGLTYDTPADMIEYYMEGIEKILIKHPEVSNDDIYVRFVEFAASSLNILVRAYLMAPTYQDELRIKESLNLALLRWAEMLGVNFAFPTTTVQVETLPGQIALSPNYRSDRESMRKNWQAFLKNFGDQITHQARDEDENFDTT